MSIKFDLKTRTSEVMVELPVELLKRLLASPNPGALRETISKLVENEETEIHDITWWKHILNWVPPYDQRSGQGGLTNEEGYLWQRVAKKIVEFDPKKDKHIILEPFQVDLIWKRLTDTRFKLLTRSMAYFDWLEDFKNAAGKHFENEDPNPA